MIVVFFIAAFLFYIEKEREDANYSALIWLSLYSVYIDGCSLPLFVCLSVTLCISMLALDKIIYF